MAILQQSKISHFSTFPVSSSYKYNIDENKFFMFVTARDVLPTWDKQIESLCYHVNHVVDLMSNQPIIRDWMNKHLSEQMNY